MKPNLLYAEEYRVYPGDYAPLIKGENISEELKISGMNNEAQLPVNIFESDDLLKVELIISGVKREDFLVQAGGNTLSVYVLRKVDESPEGKSVLSHDAGYEYFERHITLPDDADAEFVSAEYKEDVLRLHIPRTNQPSKNVHTRIVVY